VRKLLPIAAAAAACGLCAPAHAADLWLDNQHTPFYNGDYATGASLTFTVGGVNVRASGWSIDSNGVLHQASLGVWDQGMGVKYGNPDNSHTVDNIGTKDFILFQFDQTVIVDFAQLNTGWHNMYDTDATIGVDISNIPFANAPAWNNTSFATQSANLNYLYGSSAANGNSYRDINPNNVSGNLWLIGASFNNPDYNSDGFKIEKLTFTTPGTPRTPLPEPATWAMLLLGFFGLGATMRSRRNRELPAGDALTTA